MYYTYVRTYVFALFYFQCITDPYPFKKEALNCVDLLLKWITLRYACTYAYTYILAYICIQVYARACTHITVVYTYIHIHTHNALHSIFSNYCSFLFSCYRFCDTNTTVNLKCLEFLAALFGLLVAERYRLSDYEAASFLPFLMIKVTVVSCG